MHRYRTALTWSGSTKKYEGYERGHDVKIGPAPLRISADAAFLGDSDLVREGDRERVERLLHKAHQQCYIANSLTSEVALEPTIEVL